MLKRLESPYRVGRRRGDWWKWKIDPYSVDAVLIYAQHGSGRRASLFTDYTFGVWDEGQLVPFAKAYSGLTDEEIRRGGRVCPAQHGGTLRTGARGEARTGIRAGVRGDSALAPARSGIAVRFPRMARWRTDKKPEEADTLESVKKLLAQELRS